MVRITADLKAFACKSESGRPEPSLMARTHKSALPLGAVAIAFLAIGVATPSSGLAAGGAYAVDDVEVGAPGSCKVESWASYATNRDFNGVMSPACVVSLGRPVEIATQVQRFGSGGEWGSILTLKGKTTLIPVEPSKIGLGLSGGTTFDLLTGSNLGGFVVVPVTWQAHEQVRVNLNAGWIYASMLSQHFTTAGLGVEWNFVKPLTLIAESFAVFGPAQSNPRFQVGLRYTPVEYLDVDIIYGRNIAGENANWITLGLNVRFETAKK
jgi:hypothetical protein